MYTSMKVLGFRIPSSNEKRITNPYHIFVIAALILAIMFGFYYTETKTESYQLAYDSVVQAEPYAQYKQPFVLLVNFSSKTVRENWDSDDYIEKTVRYTFLVDGMPRMVTCEDDGSGWRCVSIRKR